MYESQARMPIGEFAPALRSQAARSTLTSFSTPDTSTSGRMENCADNLFYRRTDQWLNGQAQPHRLKDCRQTS